MHLRFALLPAALAVAAAGCGGSSSGYAPQPARTAAAPDVASAQTSLGHPLYTYAGDQKPGDVKGQDVDQFGGEWYAPSPSGEKVED
jgi:hypothetical protein